ncbi:MAG TPA: hypothetical protein VHE35_13875, partial [Kofleriaceae bacterium]|nr:hypothetical protein [Kofleriaceae bacterium]
MPRLPAQSRSSTSITHDDTAASPTVGKRSMTAALPRPAGSAPAATDASRAQPAPAVTTAVASSDPFAQILGPPYLGGRATGDDAAEPSAIIQRKAAAVLRLRLSLQAGSTSAEQAAVAVAAALSEADAAARDLAALAPSPGQSGPDGATDTHYAQLNRESAVHALDALTADTLVVVRALQDPAQQVVLARALDALSRSAAPLGWVRPYNLEEAQARRYDLMPCPADDVASPRACELSGAERDRRIDVVMQRMNAVVMMFETGCQKQLAAIQQAIDRDEHFAQAMAELAIGTLLTGLGGPVEEAALGVQRSVTRAATGTAASVNAAARSVTSGGAETLNGFVAEFGKQAKKAVAKELAAALKGSDAPDPRRRTINALQVLRATLTSQITASKEGLAHLDDQQLLTLDAHLQQYESTDLEAVVATYARNYLEQVAPIGIERPDSEHVVGDDSQVIVRKAVGRAVKIEMPMGGIRLALVEEVSDRVPALRRAERRALVTADRLVDDQADTLIAGSQYRVQQEAWVAEPDVELHFVR